jgi:hypothetical protein
LHDAGDQHARPKGARPGPRPTRQHVAQHAARGKLQTVGHQAHAEQKKADAPDGAADENQIHGPAHDQH